MNTHVIEGMITIIAGIIALIIILIPWILGHEKFFAHPGAFCLILFGIMIGVETIYKARKQNKLDPQQKIDQQQVSNGND